MVTEGRKGVTEGVVSLEACVCGIHCVSGEWVYFCFIYISHIHAPYTSALIFNLISMPKEWARFLWTNISEIVNSQVKFSFFIFSLVKTLSHKRKNWQKQSHRPFHSTVYIKYKEGTLKTHYIKVNVHAPKLMFVTMCIYTESACTWHWLTTTYWIPSPAYTMKTTFRAFS